MKVVVTGSLGTATYMLSNATCPYPEPSQIRTCVFNIAGLGEIQEVTIYPVSKEGIVGRSQVYYETGFPTGKNEFHNILEVSQMLRLVNQQVLLKAFPFFSCLLCPLTLQLKIRISKLHSDPRSFQNCM